MFKHKILTSIFMFVFCITITFSFTLYFSVTEETTSEPLYDAENNAIINDNNMVANFKSGTDTSNNNEMFRGVWVSTIYRIDYPSAATTSSEKLKQEATNILDNCKSMGFNAVILQVRPNSDAFYKSSIFPWSKWISGKEGVAPDGDFDPLAYWVEEAHKRDIQLHAWLNPFRVIAGVQPGYDVFSDMADNNPAKLHRNYIVKYTENDKDGYYYNPALPEVRQLIINGAVEIVKNYNVDGIHIDDYFYPGENFNDDAAFKTYGGTFSSKADWRRNNISYFIKEMTRQIHEANPNVEFGVSPSGIWANKSSNPLGSDTAGKESYNKLYADTRKWAAEGWIDYIAPQLYWYVGQKGSDYKILLDWWCDVVKNSPTKLYIGLADYKTVGVDSSNPFYNGAGIKTEMEMNAANDITKGEIHFSYSDINKVEGLKNSIISQYSTSVNKNNTNKVNSTTTNSNSTSDIKVILNGKEISFDQKPIIENSRTLVPMRAIFENLGASVNWFAETESIVAKKDDIEIIMKIGSKNIFVNGKTTINLDVAPKIVGSRTLVPLRAVSEVFNAAVSWDNNSRTVTINSK